MHLKELLNQVNEKANLRGYPPIKEGYFLKAITIMQLEGKIKLENGEVEKVDVH